MSLLDDLIFGLRRVLVKGVEMPTRGSLNFTGGVVVTDDPGGARTDVRIEGEPMDPVNKVSGETLQVHAINLLDDNGDATPTFVLPAPSTWQGRRIVAKRLNQDAASVEISVVGEASIDGAPTYTLVGTDVAAEFWSDGVSVYVGPNDVGGGGGPALSGAAPQAVGILASAGVSVDASRADHVHPHGNLAASGALHAAATTSINGFMPSTDKAKLDASTSAATASALCQRDGSGFLAVSRLTTPDLRAPTSSLDISGAPINLAAATIEIADALGGNQIAVCSIGAAARVEIQDYCTSFELRWAANGAGAGSLTTISGQRGAAGSKGGDVRIDVGGGGTSGTDLPGDLILDLGARNGANSGKLRLRAGGVNLCDEYDTAGNYIVEPLKNFVVSSGAASYGISTLSPYLQAISTGAGIQMTAAATLYSITGGLVIQVGGRDRAILGLTSATIITTATTTTILSWATTSNRVYQVEAYVTASNDTDNQGAAYFLRAAFKNVSGTVTQIGTTIVTVVGEDAGQTGLDATIDFSGTALRVRFVTDAADTVTVETLFNVYVGVLT